MEPIDMNELMKSMTPLTDPETESVSGGAEKVRTSFTQSLIGQPITGTSGTCSCGNRSGTITDVWLYSNSPWAHFEVKCDKCGRLFET